VEEGVKLEEGPVNSSQMDIKFKNVTFDPGRNIYFPTYAPTLIHFSHRFISASKPAA
jgi:hypothetical protein